MFTLSPLVRKIPSLRRVYMAAAALIAVMLLSTYYFAIATKAVTRPAEEESAALSSTGMPESGVLLLDEDRPTAPVLAPQTARLTLTRAFLVTVTVDGKCYELEALGAGALRRAVQEGESEKGCFLSGQIAAIVRKEQPAAEIVKEVMEEAEPILRRASQWVK